MRVFRLLLAIALLALGASCESLPPSQSARRYVEIPECDLTTSKFYLLDRREVQWELDLIKSQITTLAKAFNTPFTGIPELSKLKTRYQALPEDEKRGQKNQYVEERSAISLQWLESRLIDTLSDQQMGRLEALLLQMKGPKAILIVPGVIGKLGLTPDQTAKIQNIVSQSLDEMSPFSRRYGHNMLQRSRSNQTKQESEREQDALVLIMTELLKARDEAILSELTKAQCNQWHVLQGRLLTISWPENAGFYVPFHHY